MGTSEFFKQIENFIKAIKCTEILNTKYASFKELVLSNVVDPLFEKIKSKYGELLPPKKPPYCSRMFNPDELFFMCVDCAVDVACVLCYDCFVNSEHISHQYKFCMSEGALICDCRDVEAWKQYPTCSLHSRIDYDSSTESSNVVDEYAEYFADVLRMTSFVLFRLPESLDLMPTSLRSCVSNREYAVFMINDELHNLAEATGCLTNVLNFSTAEANGIIDLVDKRGRARVRQGSKEYCQNISELITANTHNFYGPMKSVVVQSVVAILQESCVISLMSFVKYLERRDYLVYVCTKVVMRSSNINNFVRPLLTQNTRIWTDARLTFHKIILSTIWLNSTQRFQFSKIFTELYPTILSHYVTDESEEENSIIHLDVKLYTIPSVVKILILESDLLKVLIKMAVVNIQHLINKKFFKNYSNEFPWSENSTEFQLQTNRTFYSVKPINYSLRVPFEPADFTDKFKAKIVEAFVHFLHLVSIFQHINAVKKSTENIQEEKPWREGFIMTFNIFNIYYQFLEILKKDDGLMLEVFGVLKNKIISYLKERVYYNRPKLKKSFAGYEFEVIDYTHEDDDFSFHTPITQLFPIFVFTFYSCGNLFDNFPDSLEFQLLYVIEPSLQSLTLCLKAITGLWRLNGKSMYTQAQNYLSQPICRDMGNLDILMLQFCASFLPPDDFFCILLDKLSVDRFLCPENYDAESGDQQRIEYASLFLDILIKIQLERYVVGLSEVTEHEILKYEIVNVLAANISLYSNIVSRFQTLRNIKETKIEDVLHEVANLCSQDEQHKHYELKDEHWEIFNPYCSNLTEEERIIACERCLRKWNTGNVNLEYFFPQKIPKFRGVFANLTKFLTCRSFMAVVKQEIELLKTCAGSESLIEKILYLIGTSLKDHENTLSHYNFSDMLVLLHPISEYVVNFDEVVSQLYSYIINKLKNLANITKGFSNDTYAIVDRNRSKRLRIERVCQMEMEIIKNRRKNVLEKLKKQFHEDCLEEQVMENVNEKICVVCKNVCQFTSLPSEQYVIMPIFIQKSHVLNQRPEYNFGKWSEFMEWDLPMGIHLSTCGHVLHLDCFKRYHLSNEQSSSNLKCPLCSRPLMAVIPLLPHYLTHLSTTGFEYEENLGFLDFVSNLDKFMHSVIEIEGNVDNMSPTNIDESLGNLICNLVSSEIMIIIKQFFDYIMNFTNTDKSRKQGCDTLWHGEQAIAYTIRCFENLMNFDGNFLINSANLYWREYDCINTCMKAYSTLFAIIPREFSVQKCANSLAFIMAHGYLPEHEFFSILDVDAFHYLVSIVLSLTGMSWFNIKQINHVFRIMYIFHIIQLFLTSGLVESKGDNLEGETCYHRVFRIIESSLGLAFPRSLDVVKFEEYLKEASFSFVRCSAIFFTMLADLTPSSFISANLCGIVSLMNYCLGSSYSSIMEFVESSLSSLTSLIESWCCPFVLSHLKASDKFPRYPLSIRMLAPLKESFTDLYHNCYQNRCYHANIMNVKKLFIPAVCLVCGKYICVTCGKYVLFEGLHVNCKLSSCLFVLDVKKCVIGIIKRNISYTPHSLYLDKYGETIIDSTYKNALSFSTYNHNKLTRSWLSHSIIFDLRTPRL